MKLSKPAKIYFGLCAISAIGLLLVLLEPSYHPQRVLKKDPDTIYVPKLPKGTYEVHIIGSIKSTWSNDITIPDSARLVPFDNHRWAWIDKRNNWISGSVLVEDSTIGKNCK